MRVLASVRLTRLDDGSRALGRALVSAAIRGSFVAGLEDQVKFFIDSGQLASARPMKDVVVTDLL